MVIYPGLILVDLWTTYLLKALIFEVLREEIIHIDLRGFITHGQGFITYYPTLIHFSTRLEVLHFFYKNF